MASLRFSNNLIAKKLLRIIFTCLFMSVEQNVLYREFQQKPEVSPSPYFSKESHLEEHTQERKVVVIDFVVAYLQHLLRKFHRDENKLLCTPSKVMMI